MDMVRQRELPPVGALTSVEQLKPDERYYLISPSPRDSLLNYLKVVPEGIRLRGYGNVETIRGLLVWNRDIWEEAPFYTESLNLTSARVSRVNVYNDAHVFRDHALAMQYADICVLKGGERIVTVDGTTYQTDVVPFLSKREGHRKRPS